MTIQTHYKKVSADSSYLSRLVMDTGRNGPEIEFQLVRMEKYNEKTTARGDDNTIISLVIRVNRPDDDSIVDTYSCISEWHSRQAMKNARARYLAKFPNASVVLPAPSVNSAPVQSAILGQPVVQQDEDDPELFFKIPAFVMEKIASGEVKIEYKAPEFVGISIYSGLIYAYSKDNDPKNFDLSNVGLRFNSGRADRGWRDLATANQYVDEDKLQRFLDSGDLDTLKAYLIESIKNEN